MTVLTPRRAYLILAVLFIANIAMAQPFQKSYPFTVSNKDTASVGKLPTEQTAVPITSRLSIANGHFYMNAGTSDSVRVRLFGTDLVYVAQFLDEPHCITLAKHLHKLGFNAVRLWYNDLNGTLCYDDANGVSSFNANPTTFALLDTLIYQLKQQGIYTIFTLHSDHQFIPGDGVFDADSGFESPENWFKEYYDARTAELYRNWAKTLLGHTNPLTGMRYADDPDIAAIELDNQAYSLSFAWRAGYLNFKDSANIYPNGAATIPYSETRRLDTLYTNYLVKKYGSEGQIAAAYAGPPVSATNLLDNGSFEDITSSAWSFNTANGTVGGVAYSSPGIDSQYYLLVHLRNLGASPSYTDAYISNSSVRIKQDSLYELKFWAKVKYNAATPVIYDTVYMYMNDLTTGAQTVATFQPIDTAWKQYSITFRGTGSDEQGLYCFVGGHLCDVGFDGMSVHRIQELGLLAGEHVATNSIVRAPFGATNLLPYQRYRDLFLFYDSLQQNFFVPTAACIRDTIKSKIMINNYSETYWGSYLDAYSNRTSDYSGGGNNYDYAYPRSSADPSYICYNRTVLGDEYNYFLGPAEAYSVSGKPFVLSGVLTPYMNQHNQELLPFIASYASLQDWDGIFLYWWAEFQQELDTDRTISTQFYSLCGNGAMLGAMPEAADMFRNFKIAPSSINITVTHTDNNMQLSGMQSRFSSPFGVDGYLDPDIGTMFAVRQSFGSLKEKISSEYPYNPTTSDTAVKVSITNELTWDPQREWFTANNAKYQSAIGYFLSDTISLNDITFTRVDPNTDEFVISLSSAADTMPISVSPNLFLTLGTRSQNTGWIWSADSLGIGVGWGTTPVLMSAERMDIAIRCDSTRLVIHPLDSTGAPSADHYDAVKIPASNMFGITIDQSTMSSPWFWVERTSQTDAAVDQSQPTNSSLAIFPNPAADNTTLQLVLQSATRISISLYDDLGRLRASVADGELSGGAHNIAFSTSSLETGHYIVKCVTPEGVMVQSLKVVK